MAVNAYPTRSSLAAVSSPSAGETAILVEQNREGIFVFRSGDRSSEVSLDPQQGLYVAPASDGSGASGVWERAKGDVEKLNVLWFGAVDDGVTDSSAAIGGAIVLGQAVGAAVYLPAGIYLMETAIGTNNLLPGTVLVGDGKGKTIVRPISTTGHYPIFVKSSSSSTSIAGIQIRGITFEDDPDRTLGFAEHKHLAHFSGIEDLLIEDCEFKGFRGDGIYLGSGDVPGEERHNRNIVIRGCTFDGIDQNNRNGISVIDGDSVTVEKCQFFNCSRPGDGTTNLPITTAQLLDPTYGLAMPGAIDCEPDEHTFHVIRNIIFDNIEIDNCGTTGIALMLRPNSYPINPYENFRIGNVRVTNSRTGFTFFGSKGSGATTVGLDYDVLVENLDVSDCEYPFIINGVRALRLIGCTFSDCTQAAVLGYTDQNFDMDLVENRFVRVGSVGINGLLIRFPHTLNLVRNKFIDCGLVSPNGGRSIYFESGNVIRVFMIGNRFDSPTGRTTYAIGVNPAATLQQDTCFDDGTNVFTFITNHDFKVNGSRAFTAAPSTGTWAVGNQVFNGAAAPTQVWGWQCTTSGSPGTWKAIASLAT